MLDGFPRRLLFAALLAFGLTAPAAAAPPAEPPVRLLAPADGTVLAAGSLATLDWTPSPELANRAQEGKAWEEWEAFLSLDGGATYPVRITPHLDRELRRVTFRVPSFPTRDGRLLLRMGDERRELAFELPERFSIKIAPGTSEALAANTPTLARAVPHRGEPARPGEPGVLAWVEGSRHGSSPREVMAQEPEEPAAAARAVPVVSSPTGTPLPAAVTTAAPPSGAPAADPGIPSILPPPQTRLVRSARVPRPAAADLLLLLQRQNE
jgi:hypothetical protein